MTDEFRKERAMTVRAIAETADPFTKKRLLALGGQVRPRAKATYPNPVYLRRTSSISLPWRELELKAR